MFAFKLKLIKFISFLLSVRFTLKINTKMCIDNDPTINSVNSEPYNLGICFIPANVQQLISQNL